jgi:DNA polymerase III subunit chi
VISAATTRVDFYHLRQGGIDQLLRFSCRLAEKAWKSGHRVFLYTQDESTARRLDELMWSYSDSSFLPHCRLGEPDAADSAVLIGHVLSDAPHDMLINLSGNMPPQPGAFQRIAEIIDETPAILESGRQRYAAYKQCELPLHYHEIQA